MDNKKIGKLIASLRKKNGLTQQELGDKVGVGFRAVSKWETGATLPDITIINELSKILGISSDELLSGELIPKDDNADKDTNKKKIPTKIKITISIITAIIIIFISMLIYNNNKAYVYKLTSTSNEYYVEGQVAFEGNKMTIVINDIKFKEQNFGTTVVKNYEYEITSGDELLFGYGYLGSAQSEEKPTTINELMKKININYTLETKINKNKILKENIDVKFKFLDKTNNEITKEIKTSLFLLDEKIAK